MRRPTAIVLVLLLLLLAVSTVVILSYDPPAEPFRGPLPGTPLPPELTRTASPTG